MDSAADNVSNWLRWDSAIDDDWAQPNCSFKLNRPTIGFMSVDRVTNPADNTKTGNIWVRDPILSNSLGSTMEVRVKLNANSEQDAFSMTLLDQLGSFGVHLSPGTIKVGGMAGYDPGGTVAFDTTDAFHDYWIVQQPNTLNVSVYVDGATQPLITGHGIIGDYAVASSEYYQFPRVLVGDESNNPHINANYVLDFVQYRRGASAPGQPLPTFPARELPPLPAPALNESWYTGYSGATGAPINTGWQEAGGNYWYPQPDGSTRLHGYANARLYGVPDWTAMTPITVEARIKVMPDCPDQAFDLVVNDVLGDIALVLSRGKVQLMHAYSFVGQVSVPMITTDAYHTYRLARAADGLYWQLYIDNNPVPAIAYQHAGGTEPDPNRIFFGGLDFPIPGNSPDVAIDYIRWHEGSAAPVPISSAWNVDADGLWSLRSNWTGRTAPDGINSAAGFGTVITAIRTVSVDGPQTLGTINFSSPISYNVAGSSPIILAMTSGGGAINVTAGSHTIAAPVILNSDTTITTAAHTGITLSGTLTASGTNLTKAGAGTVQFQNVRAARLNIADGVAQIAAGPYANSYGGTSVVNGLAISAGAQLDLTNNSMIENYATVGTLVNDTRLMIRNGQLISSPADLAHRLGYGDNAVLAKATFAGQSVSFNVILMKYTFAGDANLDGAVDVNDLGALATNWQTSAPWTGGDFNYDGFVDVSDLGILATNWQKGVGNPLGPGSFQQGLTAFGWTNIPEPASLGLLEGGALWLMSQRRALRHGHSQSRSSPIRRSELV